MRERGQCSRDGLPSVRSTTSSIGYHHRRQLELRLRSRSGGHAPLGCRESTSEFLVSAVFGGLFFSADSRGSRLCHLLRLAPLAVDRHISLGVPGVVADNVGSHDDSPRVFIGVFFHGAGAEFGGNLDIEANGIWHGFGTHIVNVRLARKTEISGLPGQN